MKINCGNGALNQYRLHPIVPAIALYLVVDC